MLSAVENACKSKKIGKLTFVRISYFQSENHDLEKMSRQLLSSLWHLKRQVPKEIIIRKNKESMILMGMFPDQSLFNLFFAVIPKQQSPYLKIEVVGENGMIQLDTSADNSFSGNFQADLLEEQKMPEDLHLLLSRIEWNKEQIGGCQ